MIAFLTQNVSMLAAGATAALLLGAVVLFFTSSPIRQLRCAELTIGLAIAWLALACVPMTRPWQRFLSNISLEVGPTQTPVEVANSPYPTRPITSKPPSIVAGKLKASGQASRAVAEPTRQTVLPDVVRATPPLKKPAVQPKDYPAAPARSSSRSANVKPATVSAAPLKKSTAKSNDLNKLPSPDAAAPVKSASDNQRQVSSGPSIDWIRITTVCFAVGSAICAAWLLLGQSVLLWIIRRANAPSPWLAQLYRHLPHRGRRPRLLVSRHCPRPVAFGLWRPTIVLPANCCATSRRQQLQHVLLHELGHIGQRDAWSQALFNAALPLLFWNPLYWLLHARARLCRELLADDWAAGQSDKESYARELVALLAGGGRLTQAGFSVSGVFRTSTEFYRRMAMLLEREERLERRCGSMWRLGAATCAGIALMLLTGAWGLSAGPEQSSGKTKLANFVYPGERDDDSDEDGEEDRTEAESTDDDEGEDGDDDAQQEDDDGDAMEREVDEANDDQGEDGDDGADDSALDELAQRRQQLQAELDELASHIDEKERARQERAAERERREAERNSRQTWEELQSQWKSMLEELDARTTERIERLENRLNETSEQVERLTGERDGLQQLLNAMQERLDESAAARGGLLAEIEALRGERAEREESEEMEENAAGEEGGEEQEENDDDASADGDAGDDDNDDE